MYYIHQLIKIVILRNRNNFFKEIYNNINKLKMYMYINMFKILLKCLHLQLNLYLHLIKINQEKVKHFTSFKIDCFFVFDNYNFIRSQSFMENSINPQLQWSQNQQQDISKSILSNILGTFLSQDANKDTKHQLSINQQKILHHVEKILLKPYQNRSNQQNSTILNFINRNKYLRSLCQNPGNDFVKGIMRNAKLLNIPKHKVIFQQGQSLDYSYLVINGSIGLIHQSQIITDIKKDQYFQHLTDLAKKQYKNINKQIKAMSNQKDQIDKITFKDTKQIYLWEQKVLKNQQYGSWVRCFSKNYLHTGITTQDSILLQFNMNFLLYWLDYCHSQKLKKQKALFEQISCFQIIPQQKLEQLLKSMTIKKKKRNQYIYKQGDSAQCIYLLTQGQIKITKQANLFQQNPNNFYIDRRKLVPPTSSKVKNPHSPKSILPYANLTNLYNYRPMNKLIQIGVLFPFCLFGQQQLIQKRLRQTNAICISLSTSYYQIQNKKIQEILGINLMDDFLRQIKMQMRKKILYRQDLYANNVQLENNKNLDYFYYQGQIQKNTPRKYNLQKINRKITPMSSAGRSLSHQLPAQYTAFNFHKMNQKSINKQRQDQYKDDNISQIDMNPIQKRLVDISHTWRPIHNQVRQQIQLSKKISPMKQSIDLKSPLFDPKFFQQVHLENKRIDKDFRTKKYSYGKQKKRTLQNNH